MKPKGFFITGTDTGVGKTVVTASLLSLFKDSGLDAGVMKPVETGVDPECSSAANSDALFLMEISGHSDELSLVSPVRLKPAASPYQASRMTNQKIDLPRIIKNYHQLAEIHEYMMVEGIGGLFVPLTRHYQVADLVRDMGLPLIVVSRTTLGTLNHTLLTLKAAREEGIEIAGVIFNQMEDRELDEIERGHSEIITELSGIPVIGICPYLGNISGESFSSTHIEELRNNWNMEILLGAGK